MRELTQRQKLFCENFVKNGGNGAAAVRAAGYKYRASAGCSYKLLNTPRVQQYLTPLILERSRDTVDEMIDTLISMQETIENISDFNVQVSIFKDIKRIHTAMFGGIRK